jgi:hypothetical protein
MSENMGASTSRNPKGLHGLLAGEFYLYLKHHYNPEDRTLRNYRCENVKFYKIRATILCLLVSQQARHEFCCNLSYLRNVRQNALSWSRKISFSLVKSQTMTNMFSCTNTQIRDIFVHFACASTSKTLHIDKLCVIPPLSLSNVWILLTASSSKAFQHFLSFRSGFA